MHQMLTEEKKNSLHKKNERKLEEKEAKKSNLISEYDIFYSVSKRVDEQMFSVQIRNCQYFDVKYCESTAAATAVSTA